MKFEQNLKPILENKTKVKLLRSRIEYDYIICGSNAFLSCILARTLSDNGFKVAIINKRDKKVGFDGFLNDLKFLAFICKSLGVEVGKLENQEQLIFTLFRYALHPENIDYFGEDYRIRDYGYDGFKNYFVADISRTHKRTVDDEVIYGNSNPIDKWFRAFYPRNMKIRQLIGNNLIVTHWHDFMFGWTSERKDSIHTYLTQRPKTVMLFGAHSIRLTIQTEADAKYLLEQEATRAVEIIQAIQKLSPE
ncbi:hypothetical protein OTK49_00625 [Vibrio coralliirubri]|uniref:hypothetical protein n=1 Tax=Vibrio coralliirubri TaxID=1516159 RepID=UPI0022847F6A|nr:hypothetical protein [Vibrio coralliirubri]MCY9861046.1 hypothetical protein [Vibrio coralliirubri]